jgi:hypothetical protein
MDQVRVKKNELLAIVKKNRAEHRELFLKAQDGFRARAIEELDDMLKAARDKKEVRLFVGLTAPQDHTAEYDRSIHMLEMSQDEIVEIDEGTFAQLVRNEWSWFAQTNLINSTYSSGGKLGGSH